VGSVADRCKIHATGYPVLFKKLVAKDEFIKKSTRLKLNWQRSWVRPFFEI